MKKEIPTYDIQLGDWDAGVYAISLVDIPAIESDFLHFSNQKEHTSWYLADEEKMEIVGAVLIPDKLIYRKLDDGTEFNIRFSKEVISQINEKLNDTNGDKYFTIQHELDARDTVKMTEKWIKETDEDKSVALGINEPIGTLFAKCKISSDLIWDNIKGGKLNGFSVELDASVIKSELNKQIKNESMDFKKMYENSLLVNETELLFNGELSKSSLVFHVTGADDESKLEPFTGEFTDNNIEYTIKDGLVTEVNDIQLSIEEKIIGLTNELKELKELLSKDDSEPLDAKLDAILTKMEEDRLKLAQEDNKVDDNIVIEKERISTELLSNVRSWGSKWNKK